MRELYSQNREKISVSHDLWILMKKSFTKSDSDMVEKLFLDALQKIEKR